MSINISSLTTDELIALNRDVVALIKIRRNNDARLMRSELSLGDSVWVDARQGRMEGTVKKIMRTRAIVHINGVDYKVPMSIIEHK